MTPAPSASGSTMRSLTRREDFLRVYSEGLKLTGRFCVLYLLPAGDLARAVVASRKVGGAVARNRAKRLLREMLRHLVGAEATALDFDLVAARLGRNRADCGDGMWIVAVARARLPGAGIHDLTAEAQSLLADFLPG